MTDVPLDYINCMLCFSMSQYNLYEDDGNSTKYEPGSAEYSTQLFTMKAIDQYVTQQYSYMCM